MIDWQRRSPADSRFQEWKNGRGKTEEIMIDPPGSDVARDDFTWRVSRAAVIEDGAFSTFPGCERVLIILEGGPLELRHGSGAPIRLERHRIHRFRGDDATSARLLGPTVADFNVIWRRGVVDIDVRWGSARAGSTIEVSARRRAGLCVIEGAVLVPRLDARPFVAGDSLFAEGGPFHVSLISGDVGAAWVWIDVANMPLMT